MANTIDWKEVAANAKLGNGSSAPEHLKEFILNLGPSIERNANLAGLPVDIILAQMAYESGMMYAGDGPYNAFQGKQEPISKITGNYAGLKGYASDPLWDKEYTTKLLSYEYDGGKHVDRSPFRDYKKAREALVKENPGVEIPSEKELFVRDYITKLLYSERSAGDPRYHGAFGQDNPIAFAKGLRAGGYFTDTAESYAKPLQQNVNALMPNYQQSLPDNKTALAQAQKNFPDPRENEGVNHLIHRELSGSNGKSLESPEQPSTQSQTASTQNIKNSLPAPNQTNTGAKNTVTTSPSPSPNLMEMIFGFVMSLFGMGDNNQIAQIPDAKTTSISTAPKNRMPAENNINSSIAAGQLTPSTTPDVRQNSERNNAILK